MFVHESVAYTNTVMKEWIFIKFWYKFLLNFIDQVSFSPDWYHALSFYMQVWIDCYINSIWINIVVLKIVSGKSWNL